MKFRKKPVVIEATQWFKNGDHPAVYTKRDSASDLWGYIKTLEGEHIVTPGDWIITGVKGEYYPCKPDIFEMTYEPADSVKQPAQQPAQQPICGLDVYLDPNDGLKPKLFPKKPAQPSKPLTDDPLQGAVDWLLQADGEYFCTATVQRTLRIGYNRAKRLCDTAKERAAHGIKGDA